MQTLMSRVRAVARALLPVVAALVLTAPSMRAAAADYPTRPIKLVSASSPGSGGDVVARLLAAELEKSLGATVIVDNKPGAEGIIASSTVVSAKPDGHTLLLNYTSHVINPSLREQPFDAIRDFTPISMVSTNWTLLVVRGESPVKTVADLVALARKKPGSLSVGFLPGSVTHMAAELLFAEMGLDVLRVPYKTNNEAIRDLIGGQVDFGFSTLAPIQGMMQSGKLRAIAMTEPRRSDLLPGVPAMAETIPGFAVTGWYGLVGPKGMPPTVVATLNGAVRRVLSDPSVKTRLLDMGSEPTPGTPQEFAAFIAAEIPRWQAVIKKAKLK